MTNHDPLERELAALRPIEPSPQLRARLAQQLDEEARPASRAQPLRGMAWLAAAGGALAASVAIYALFRGADGPPTAPAPIDFRTESTTAAAFDAALPSLWSYRRALDRSADDVDALLDRHARDSAEQTPASQRAGVAAMSVFARSDSQLETLLGEL
jgi:hypothetical protein